MNPYITGSMIKKLREKKKYTQKELSDKLNVSEKTISKWETGRGLPDITLLEPLSKILEISLIELFNGKETINKNRNSNLLKTCFYVCPICGNVITTIGEGTYSCCGCELIKEEEENCDIEIEYIDNELYIKLEKQMTKSDYISFIAYVTQDNIQFKKLYPEQSCEARFLRNGHGIIYYYNNKEGLFKKKI